jgi:hypothetical protein
MYPLSTELSVSRGGAAGRATLTRTQPWPTLFWLICTLLRADVSKLEVATQRDGNHNARALMG